MVGSSRMGAFCQTHGCVIMFASKPVFSGDLDVPLVLLILSLLLVKKQVSDKEACH